VVEKKFRGILAKPLVGRQLLSLMLVAASETTRVLVSPTTSFWGSFLRRAYVPRHFLRISYPLNGGTSSPLIPAIPRRHSNGVTVVTPMQAEP